MKGGVNIEKNEKEEMVSNITIKCCRICINHMMLNKATRKNHFPLSFFDRMLDTLGRSKVLLLLGWIFLL